MHFRPPRGQRWRSLTVRALGKKLKVRKRPLLWVAVISLHGLHKDLYVVTAEGRTRSGKRVRLRTRRYHTCDKKLPGHVPKHKRSQKK